MADQIRIVLTVDDAAKKMIEDSANEYCGGNTSAYVRGLVVLHFLLQNKDVGTDIPGWMLRIYPLRLITRLSENIGDFHKNFVRTESYDRVASAAPNPPQVVPRPSAATPIEGPKEPRQELEIRINDLARELEVKASTIIDLLPSLGTSEQKTHSSSVPFEIAQKIRQLFRKNPDLR